jgi:hypothetical protein
MTKRAAIFGSLVDVRNIGAHKCARLTVEVPAEQAAEIIAMFGWPTQAAPVPVAIARMVGEGTRPEPQRSLSQQAGALCNDATFQGWMKTADRDACATKVREYCEVHSRAEIKVGTPAGDAWSELVEQFRTWQAAERAGAI